MNKVQLTREGFEKIQEELKELNDNKKPATIQRLSSARAMGDLSENSEYTAAKEELAFVEGRIREIDAILQDVEIVENQKADSTVALGNKVAVQSNDRGKEDFYIVGEFEADPIQKKLSHASPIGRALLGKRIGDTVEVVVPAGKISYKILQIG